MITVRGTIQCYRCDTKIDVDLEVEAISIGASKRSTSGLVVKEPSESQAEGWALISEPYSYGADSDHWYCPKHWKPAKGWPGKEAVY
jgi:hypothetical protein